MEKPTPEEIALLHDRFCSAINDPTRLRLIYELAAGPQYVSRLVKALELPQGTVSRHLRILRDHGVVSARRKGNRVLYELVDSRVIDVIDLLRVMLTDLLDRQGATAGRIRPAN